MEHILTRKDNKMKPVDRVHVLFCLSIHSVEAPVLSEVFHRGILEQNSDHGFSLSFTCEAFRFHGNIWFKIILIFYIYIFRYQNSGVFIFGVFA